MVVSIGGLLNGLVHKITPSMQLSHAYFSSLGTGVIGPVTVMPSFVATFGQISASLHGFVVSSVLLSATLASLFSGTVSDNLGRTRTLAIGAFVFAAGATIEAGASKVGVLILGRLVVGIGEGLFLSTLVVLVLPLIREWL